MAKNLFSGWKKFSTNGKNTIMAHPSGHKMIIQHKHLKPEHLEQLHSLPFAGAEKTAPAKMASGGEVKDAPPLEADKKENDKDTYHPSGDINSPDYDPTLDKKLNHFAEGTPDAPIQAPAAVEAPVETSAQPAPSPTPADPELQQKREMYNHLVSTSTGRGFVASPDKAFGPNGEAPKTFDAGAWREAQAKYSEAQTQKAQEGQQQAATTAEENNARQAAGLSPLPAPAAAMAANQDPALKAQVAQPVTPQAPQDPYGTQAYSDAYTKGVAEQKAGLQQEADAQTKMGNEQAASLQKGQEVQQAALQNYQTHYQNLENERQGLIKDINDKHIDPNHLIGNMDTASRVSTAIGLIAGGIGGAITHQENPAMKFLNAQIDRDISAQRAELGKSENLLSANMHQFGNIRDATEMTRVMQTDIISNQLKQEAAKATGPLAKARLLQAAGQLDQQTAPVLSQIAMRKTLLSGMQSGHIAPEQVIRSIVPQGEQQAAYKELKEAQDMNKAKDNILSAYSQIAKMNTVAGNLSSPIQTRRAVAAIKEPIVAGLSKATAGRFTEQDAHMLDTFFPSPGDSAQTSQIKQAALNKLLSEKMHFPLLKAYGIDMNSAGRYNPQGQSRVPESAPVTK